MKLAKLTVRKLIVLLGNGTNLTCILSFCYIGFFFILTTFQKLTHNVAILRIYLAVVFQEGVPGF